MTDWKFTKRGAQCSQCTRPFGEGEPHVSSLAVEGEAVARVDACLACWKRRAGADDLFWWRTRHTADKPRGLALNLEALESLFFALGSREQTSLRELRYVLCLILMRKRRLKIERVGRSTRGEVLVVSRPRREELHEVDVFDFTPEKIDELRSRLQDVFEQGDLAMPGDGGASDTASNDVGPESDGQASADLDAASSENPAESEAAAPQ